MERSDWFGVIFLILLMVGVCAGIVKQMHKDSDLAKVQREEQQKKNIIFGDFIKLTRVSCSKISEVFPEESLNGLEDFDRGLTSCTTTFDNFYLRRSLIRYKQEMFYVTIHLYEPHEHLASLREVNIPYCLIGTDKNEFPVLESCDRIK